MDSSVNSASIGKPPRHVLIVCNDLYFRVHLESQVRAAGMLSVPIASAAAAAEVPQRDEMSVRGAVVDLRWDGGDPVEAIRVFAAMPDPFPILAFGPHVERDALAQARAAGAIAMPRSRFVREYEGFLQALSLGLPWPGERTLEESEAAE